ncbi:hypothetical protein T06_3563, partial [Trichinella sp. T6]
MLYSLIGKVEFSSTHPYALLVRDSFRSPAQMVRMIFHAKVPCREYY